jgi:hypothetical protein
MHARKRTLAQARGRVEHLNHLKHRLGAALFGFAVGLAVNVGTASADAGLLTGSYHAVAPADAADITDLMDYFCYGVGLSLLVGAGIAAIGMGVSHRNQGGQGIGEHFKGFAAVLGAAAFFGMAPTLINGLV